jgi:hypothetical protein
MDLYHDIISIDRDTIEERVSFGGEVTAKPAPGEKARPGDNGVDGYKRDEGKLQFDEISIHMLEELAKVMTCGAQKYPRGNARKGMAWSRPYNAFWRHVLAWLKGEKVDHDSGAHPLGHAIWNLMTLMDYEKRGVGFDDVTQKYFANEQEILGAVSKPKTPEPEKPVRPPAESDPRERFNVVAVSEKPAQDQPAAQVHTTARNTPDSTAQAPTKKPSHEKATTPETWPAQCAKFGDACMLPTNPPRCPERCFFYPKKADPAT